MYVIFTHIHFITDIEHYTHDQMLLVNTPAQTEFQLYNLGQAAGGIGLNMNANKTEFMHFKQKRATSTLSDRSLKLVDQFPYLGNNISFTESKVNVLLAKAWTEIDRLSIIWKFDQWDEIKRDLFQAVTGSILLYRWTT